MLLRFAILLALGSLVSPAVRASGDEDSPPLQPVSPSSPSFSTPSSPARQHRTVRRGPLAFPSMRLGEGGLDTVPPPFSPSAAIGSPTRSGALTGRPVANSPTRPGSVSSRVSWGRITSEDGTDTSQLGLFPDSETPHFTQHVIIRPDEIKRRASSDEIIFQTRMRMLQEMNASHPPSTPRPFSRASSSDFPNLQPSSESLKLHTQYDRIVTEYRILVEQNIVLAKNRLAKLRMTDEPCRDPKELLKLRGMKFRLQSRIDSVMETMDSIKRVSKNVDLASRESGAAFKRLRNIQQKAKVEGMGLFGRSQSQEDLDRVDHQVADAKLEASNLHRIALEAQVGVLNSLLNAFLAVCEMRKLMGLDTDITRHQTLEGVISQTQNEISRYESQFGLSDSRFSLPPSDLDSRPYFSRFAGPSSPGRTGIMSPQRGIRSSLLRSDSIAILNSRRSGSTNSGGSGGSAASSEGE